eukprot:scaffold218929_cov15-Tisochrysis_lutea.AAC.1
MSDRAACPLPTSPGSAPSVQSWLLVLLLQLDAHPCCSSPLLLMQQIAAAPAIRHTCPVPDAIDHAAYPHLNTGTGPSVQSWPAAISHASTMSQEQAGSEGSSKPGQQEQQRQQRHLQSLYRHQT